MDIKTGYFKSDGNTLNVILGFVPDYLEIYFDFTGVAAPTIYKWSKAIADGALTGQYGFQDASTGDWVACADAANGIVAFDSSGDYVLIDSPIPAAGKKATAVNTTAWASLTPVARSATVIGTIKRPTVRNGRIYECTTLVGAATTEPTTWPTTPGATVLDGGTNVWTCRMEEVCRGGGKGFTLGATLQSDEDYAHFIAYRTDKDRYLGDAADGDLSII